MDSYYPIMKKYWQYATAAILAVSSAACQQIGEEEQKGIFTITNQSGQDVEVRVYRTQNRRQPPLILALPHAASVERTAYGGAGNIAYPELFSQGDSVRLVFQDGKQLLHYCPQAQQAGQCQPVRNLLSLGQYQIEALDEHTNRFSYTITAAEYAGAR